MPAVSRYSFDFFLLIDNTGRAIFDYTSPGYSFRPVWSSDFEYELVTRWKLNGGGDTRDEANGFNLHIIPDWKSNNQLHELIYYSYP